jgi:hypothetical protein
MQKIVRLVRLISRIALKGKFRYTGVDYSARRKDVLEELTEFCPEIKGKSEAREPKNNHLRFAIIGEVAFLKNGLKIKGGHLTAPLLNLSYVRIPKAASTAISSAMLHASYPALKTHALSPEKINYLADVNLRTRITAAEENATFFTLVRNPFGRIVSVYREFFENQPDPFIYEDYLFGIFRRNVSFKEFITTLQLIPDVLKDQHLRPQHLYLRFYSRKKIFVHIFRLEESAAWKDFLRAYGLEIKMIHASPTPYDYATYYDKETLEIVFGLYRADVAEFGYEPAYRELQVRVQSGGRSTAG